MGACNVYQIRKIYAIAGALGMVSRDEDDALHDLVRDVTGKDSVKKLEYAEAFRIIGELEKKQGVNPTPRTNGHGSRPKSKSKPGGASDGQQRKVWALMYQLEKESPSKAALGDRLCGIIKRELHRDAFAKDPFAWMDYKECNRLVEILKGYVKTATGKAAGCDG